VAVGQTRVAMGRDLPALARLEGDAAADQSSAL
jgi:hypothetical protein